MTIFFRSKALSRAKNLQHDDTAQFVKLVFHLLSSTAEAVVITIDSDSQKNTHSSKEDMARENVLRRDENTIFQTPLKRSFQHFDI